jgi:hypothetical protein
MHRHKYHKNHTFIVFCRDDSERLFLCRVLDGDLNKTKQKNMMQRKYYFLRDKHEKYNMAYFKKCHL